MPAKPQVVRVRAVYDFIGIVPTGANYRSPEEHVKSLFRMNEVGIPGFVLEAKELIVKAQETDLPEIS